MDRTATGVCWLGMEVFFAVTFSGMVTSDDRKYGPSRSARSLGFVATPGPTRYHEIS